MGEAKRRQAIGSAKADALLANLRPEISDQWTVTLVVDPSIMIVSGTEQQMGELFDRCLTSANELALATGNKRMYSRFAADIHSTQERTIKTGIADESKGVFAGIALSMPGVEAGTLRRLITITPELDWTLIQSISDIRALMPETQDFETPDEQATMQHLLSFRWNMICGIALVGDEFMDMAQSTIQEQEGLLAKTE